MDATLRDEIGAMLGRVPSGLFVLTTKYEDRRAGMLASWVQQVCFEPAMVSVAIAKHRPIRTIISESRRFGLCQVPKGDRLLMRRFAGSTAADEDPFLGVRVLDRSATGVPIVTKCLGYLECLVTHHVDVDGDHDLFIGTVSSAGLLNGDNEPHVHLRDNGFRY